MVFFFPYDAKNNGAFRSKSGERNIKKIKVETYECELLELGF